MKKPFLLMICLAIPLVGVVVFFPIRIGCCRTCLADLRPCLHPEGGVPQRHNLIESYVYPYGLLWWGSLLTGTIAVALLNQQDKGKSNGDLAACHEPDPEGRRHDRPDVEDEQAGRR